MENLIFNNITVNFVDEEHSIIIFDDIQESVIHIRNTTFIKVSETIYFDLLNSTLIMMQTTFKNLKSNYAHILHFDLISSKIIFKKCNFE